MKIWATTKVQIMLTETLMLWAAERISSGKISLGTNQLRGPQDHANPTTYTQIHMTTTIAYHFDRVSGSPSTPNLQAIAIAITIYKQNSNLISNK